MISKRIKCCPLPYNLPSGSTADLTVSAAHEFGHVFLLSSLLEVKVNVAKKPDFYENSAIYDGAFENI